MYDDNINIPIDSASKRYDMAMLRDSIGATCQIHCSMIIGQVSLKGGFLILSVLSKANMRFGMIH